MFSRQQLRLTKNPFELKDLFKLLQDGNENDFIAVPNLSDFMNVLLEGRTLLQWAAVKGLPEAVKKLLSEGAEIISTEELPSAIEITVIKGDYKVFEVFVEDRKIVIPETLLQHLCVSEPIINEDNSHHKCLDLWLEKRNNIDGNTEIDVEKNTLLHYTAKYRGSEKTLQLLRRGASMASSNANGTLAIEYIDFSTLETWRWIGKERAVAIRELIAVFKRSKWQMFSRQQLRLTKHPFELKDLFKLLQDGNENDFIAVPNLSDFMNVQLEGQTLLQCAADKGLPEAVKKLLSEGAELTSTEELSSAIEITVIKGDYKVFEVFADDPKIVIPETLLQHLCLSDPVINEDNNHHRCLDLWLERRDNIDGNTEIDVEKNTLLHYTAKYRGSEKTLQLLRRGASMASSNTNGTLAIEYIDFSTLETHLNECLEVDWKSNTDRKDLTATVNYKTLMPPRNNNNQKFVDAETSLKKEKCPTKEMVALMYMIKIPELQQLLKHPVVTTFFRLKWNQIRLFAAFNLIISIIFCYILLFMIVSDTNVVGPIRIVLIISMVCLFIRECIAIYRYGISYFFNLGNWIPLLMVLLGFAVIIVPFTSVPEKVIPQIQPFFILTMSFEIMRLIGHFPEISTYAVMVRTVSFSFFKFLTCYFIFVLAFTLNFYLLEIFNDSANITKNIDTKDFANFVAHFPLTLFKTIVMMTGDLNFDSLNFETFPIVSHLIFLMFVFFVTIILLNLLTGLAVSDMQKIKNNTELFSNKQCIEYINSIENVLLFLPAFSFISRFFLKDQQVLVYPNQNAKVKDVKYSLIFNFNVYLGMKIAKSMKQVINKKKETAYALKTQEQQQQYLQELEKKIDYIFAQIKINQTSNDGNMQHSIYY